MNQTLLESMHAVASILRDDADKAAAAAIAARADGNKSEAVFHTGRQSAFLSAANLAMAAYNGAVAGQRNETYDSADPWARDESDI